MTTFIEIDLTYYGEETVEFRRCIVNKCIDWALSYSLVCQVCHDKIVDRRKRILIYYDVDWIRENKNINLGDLNV